MKNKLLLLLILTYIYPTTKKVCYDMGSQNN